MSDDIASRVKKIVAEELGHAADKIGEDSRFVEDLGADSLDSVELVMRLEEEFECEIPDDQADKFLTVGSVVEFIRSQGPSEEPKAAS